MKLCTGQFNIETAFLYSELGEEIFMRIPEGCVRYMLEVHPPNWPSTHVLVLKKSIYGLVQAARQWSKKLKEAMAGCNNFPS
jgi:Reverse transcriptase (RNA-dependent DNA polymerase)